MALAWQTLSIPAGVCVCVCGFKAEAVMNSGINDTARCAPGTARPAAVNWGCNGGRFSGTCLKTADEERDSIISECIRG